MAGQHTPGQDREYVEYVRPIQHKVPQRLVSIIDRLEAEKAELVEALQKSENEIENAIIGLRTDPLAYVEAIKQRLEQVLTEVNAALAKHGPSPA